jgi:hypothetical protein
MKPPAPEEKDKEKVRIEAENRTRSIEGELQVHAREALKEYLNPL